MAPCPLTPRSKHCPFPRSPTGSAPLRPKLPPVLLSDIDGLLTGVQLLEQRITGQGCGMSVLGWIGIGLDVLSVATGLGGCSSQALRGSRSTAPRWEAYPRALAWRGTAGPAGLRYKTHGHGEACYGLGLGLFGALSGAGAVWGSVAVIRGAGAFTARNKILQATGAGASR